MSRGAWELASGSKEPALSALFKGASLINHKGEAVSMISTLKDRTVLLYFAASWAEPCRDFNELLSKFHDAVRETGDDSILVIFVSNDKSKEEQVKFFNDDSMHAEWLMAEWTYDLQDMMDHFNIENIPWLLVVDRDGKAVVKDARDIIFDIFTEKNGKLKKPEEAKAAAKARWSDWRRLAGDWRASEGHTLGGSASSAAPASAAGSQQGSAQSDREALRAARLAALERRGAAAPTGALSSSSAPASMASAQAPAPAASAVAAPSGPRIVGLGGGGALASGSLATGSGSFAAGAAGPAGGGVAYTLAGGRVELPPPAPAPQTSAADDDCNSDMASIDAAESVRDDLDGDMAIEMEEAVASVTAMGFPEQQAREALQVTHGDPDRAVALLLGET